jgi:hypothetical protein
MNEKYLKDELPEVLFLVESLSKLNLADNQLSGSLEGIFQGSGAPSTSLESCNLHSNKFTCVIPPEFGSMTGLRLFWLYDNQPEGPRFAISKQSSKGLASLFLIALLSALVQRT